MSGKNFAALRILSVVLAGYSGSALYAQPELPSDTTPLQAEALAMPETGLQTTETPAKKSLTWSDEQGGALEQVQEIPARGEEGDTLVAETQDEAAIAENAKIESEAEKAKIESDFDAAKKEAEKDNALEELAQESEFDLYAHDSLTALDSDWTAV